MISGDSAIAIRKATLGDIDRLKELADAHRRELGFVRRQALVGAIGRAEVLVAHGPQTAVGFLVYHHRRDGHTTIYEVVIEAPHRGRGMGRALLEALRLEARSRGQCAIRAKCPRDLAANGFYHHLGYLLDKEETGKARPLCLWVLPV